EIVDVALGDVQPKGFCGGCAHGTHCSVADQGASLACVREPNPLIAIYNSRWPCVLRGPLCDIATGQDWGLGTSAAPARRRYTVSTILPTWLLVSRRRCASAAFASGNVESITTLTLPAANSGHTRCCSARAKPALTARVRGRSVEPVMVSRFIMTRAMLHFTSAPPSVAICTMRPSSAAARMLRSV